MELLAPGGNLRKLKTSVLYGANAVYFAGQKFSLRGASENFSDAEIMEGVTFAKERNCKVYVTLNAFLHDDEIAELKKYVKILENCGVDAVIVSDLGVMTIVQKNSKLPIHISTQASCLNINAAKLWKNLGAKRIVLGREVSIDEASKIKKEVGIEVELFIHGSMCMAYSGNCIISNYTAGRDSNRGGCIQSCRFSYSAVPVKSVLNDDLQDNSQNSLMSSKDLRAIELLPKFVEAEIDCVKIEGRMKSNLYAATTSNAYSRALKLCESTPLKELPDKLKDLSNMLEKIPHRGYTEGSLRRLPDSKSIYEGRRNSRNSIYEFVGTVMEVEDRKSFTILTQNPIDKFSTLEILSFDGNVIEVTTQKMESISKEPVIKSKPNMLVRFPYSSSSLKFNDSSSSKIEPLNVVRIKSCFLD